MIGVVKETKKTSGTASDIAFFEITDASVDTICPITFDDAWIS